MGWLDDGKVGWWDGWMMGWLVTYSEFHDHLCSFIAPSIAIIILGKNCYVLILVVLMWLRFIQIIIMSFTGNTPIRLFPCSILHQPKALMSHHPPRRSIILARPKTAKRGNWTTWAGLYQRQIAETQDSKHPQKLWFNIFCEKYQNACLFTTIYV